MTDAAAGAAQGAGGDGAQGEAQGAGAAAIVNGDGKSAPDFINAIPEGAREYVTNKGWKSPADLLTSYQKLESAFGSNKVVLPKEGDAASEAEFRKALGVPETADKYEIKLPEGAPIDETFLKTAKGWMHEAGLTPKQAQIIASKWNEFTDGALKSSAQGKLKASEDGLKAVEKEWGAQTDAHKAAAQRAFKAVSKAAGLEAADLDAIEDTIGTPKMLKLFAHFGGMIAEARFVDGGAAKGSHFTPEAARARMAELRGDRAWFAKFTGGDAGAKAEWAALQAAVAAGLAA